MIKIPCYHPTFVQQTCYLHDGRIESKFLGSIEQLELCNPWVKDVLKESFSGDRSDLFIPRVTFGNKMIDFKKIPCGKCIGCRIDYSRSWADRLTYHSIGKEGRCFFITLTYDDDHLDSLGVTESGLYSLNYSDMDVFIKKLRNKFRDDQLDYYYSGEYGDHNFRPHFHLILYNVDLNDLVFWKTNNEGDPLYTSDTIDGLWNQGFSAVAPFSWLNAAYTASYVEKKRDGRMMAEYTAFGLEPEKCRCSRRPGIAFDYYQEHSVDLWNNDGLKVSRDVNRCGSLGMPRYFRKLVAKYAREDPEAWQAFLDFEKRCLERSNVSNPLKIDNSSFDLDRVSDLLKFEEREILSKSLNKKL